jgi:hypothetical protein
MLQQCPPLNGITLGQHRTDSNNRMIQLTELFFVLLRYNGTSNIWLQYAADSIICDPIKWWHCIRLFKNLLYTKKLILSDGLILPIFSVKAEHFSFQLHLEKKLFQSVALKTKTVTKNKT